MSEGSETPPKFVPTLTEVVAMPSLGAAATGAQAFVAADLAQSAEAAELGSALENVDRNGAGAAPSDRRWLARRGVQGIPANLPPLPDSLPPQAFASERAATEIAHNHSASASASVSVSVFATGAPELTTLIAAAGDSSASTSSTEALNMEPVLAVVDEDSFPAIDSGFMSAPATLKVVETSTASYETQEAIVQRSLYRVEQMIEMRLQETVAALVEEHAQALSMQLRQQVEAIVRKSVQDVLKSTMATTSLKNENDV